MYNIDIVYLVNCVSYYADRTKKVGQPPTSKLTYDAGIKPRSISRQGNCMKLVGVTGFEPAMLPTASDLKSAVSTISPHARFGSL